MAKSNPYELDVVSIRLKKDYAIISENPITSAEDAVKLLREILSELDREVICVINLKTNGTPINCHFVSMGCLNNALAHPREILKAGILSNAASMILAHNHPSGEISPSREDALLTKRMAQACKLIGIPLLDHVIIGANNENYFSFLNNGLLEATRDDDYDYQIIKMEVKEPYKGRGR